MIKKENILILFLLFSSYQQVKSVNTLTSYAKIATMINTENPTNNCVIITSLQKKVVVIITLATVGVFFFIISKYALPRLCKMLSTPSSPKKLLELTPGYLEEKRATLNIKHAKPESNLRGRSNALEQTDLKLENIKDQSDYVFIPTTNTQAKKLITILSQQEDEYEMV